MDRTGTVTRITIPHPTAPEIVEPDRVSLRWGHSDLGLAHLCVSEPGSMTVIRLTPNAARKLANALLDYSRNVQAVNE